MPELVPWHGKLVQLRVDEQDVTRVSIWSAMPDDRFICEAPAVELATWGPMDREKSKRMRGEIARPQPGRWRRSKNAAASACA